MQALVDSVGQDVVFAGQLSVEGDDLLLCGGGGGEGVEDEGFVAGCDV